MLTLSAPPKGPVKATALSPDGLSIAIAVGNDVALIDTVGGPLKRMTHGQDYGSVVTLVAFSSDGKRILAGASPQPVCFDKTVAGPERVHSRIEALERFVRQESLRRVNECVFGVLALESEPVDPRL